MNKMNRKNTALMVIDMQNAFLSPQGSIARMGIPIGRVIKVIKPVGDAISRFRKLEIPVIYNQMALRKDFSDAGMMLEAFPSLKELGHTVRGSWDGEIISELKPQEWDTVVMKSRFDGFYNTDLEIVLRNRNILNLVFVGIATNICVETTVRSAFCRDYRCFVPRETTASFTAEMEEGAFGNFKFGFAHTPSILEIFDILEKKS